MVTFKRFRSIGLGGLFFAVCMLAFTVAQAQTQVDATILTTNVDVQKKKLYVEMNYTPKACGNYQLRFRLEKKGGVNLGYAVLTLDSVISNNHGTQKIASYSGVTPAIKVLNLDNTAVGGYSLRFGLSGAGATLTAADSPRVCLETYRIAYRCRYCGTNRSDILFTPKDADPACPYTGDDLVACSQRVGGAKNWEAYIQDPRDCRVYRIVQMPDGKWWFAQNLNYQKDLITKGSADPGNVTGIGGNTAGYYWCPGPEANNVNPTYEAGNLNAVQWACEVYGALYTWGTARKLDGTGTETPSAGTAFVANTNTSAIRGICPPSWFLPNDADWGVMLNASEGCPTPTAFDGNTAPLNPPCNHLLNFLGGTIADATARAAGGPGVNGAVGVQGGMGGTVAYYNLGYQAGKFLKATPTCPTGVICDNTSNGSATANYGLYVNSTNPNSTTNPRYAYTRWVYSSRDNTGNDRFGFSVLPAGYRYGDNTAAGGVYQGRGQFAIFLSSTYYSGTGVSSVMRQFSFDAQDVKRLYQLNTSGAMNSLHAFSVRCVK